MQVWLGHAHWHLSGGGKGPAAACQIMQRAIKVGMPAAAVDKAGQEYHNSSASPAELQLAVLLGLLAC